MSEAAIVGGGLQLDELELSISGADIKGGGPRLGGSELSLSEPDVCEVVLIVEHGGQVERSPPLAAGISPVVNGHIADSWTSFAA